MNPLVKKLARGFFTQNFILITNYPLWKIALSQLPKYLLTTP